MNRPLSTGNRTMTARQTLVFAVALFAMTTTSFASDWTQFRGPGGLGISDEKDLPAKWSSTENIVWKSELPGPGSSSAIILGNRVFLTAYTGYGIEPNK